MNAPDARTSGEASPARTLGRGVTAAEWRAPANNFLLADRVGGDPRAVLNGRNAGARSEGAHPTPPYAGDAQRTVTSG